MENFNSKHKKELVLNSNASSDFVRRFILFLINKFCSDLISPLKSFHLINTKKSKRISIINSISEYRKQISGWANNKSSDLIENDGEEKARIIFINIFQTAEKYVYIFAGNLCGPISNDEYVTALESFLKKDNVKLKIILEQEPNINKSKCLKFCYDFIEKNGFENGKIEISYASNLELTRLLKGKIKHFVVSDDRMVRIEEDTKSYIGFASYNNKEIAFKLKNKFHDILKVATSALPEVACEI